MIVRKSLSLFAMGLAAALAILCGPPVRAQVLINEGFENIATLPASGWVQVNNSFPLGTGWLQGTTPFPFAAQSGSPPSYIRATSAATSGFNATISLWLLTPEVTFRNGQIFRFWTRTRSPVQFPDRLQVRMSLSGASIAVGNTNESVGVFTELLLDINPGYSFTGYPTTWTQFTITISGLAVPTNGRLAFRYFVEDTADNADVIGIDTVTLEEAAPDPCQQALPSCPADIAPAGGDNVVDVNDLLPLIGSWGQTGPPRPAGDIAPPPVGDCLVDVNDLLSLVGSWGACGPATGACCMSGGSCTSQTQSACTSAGGTYQGDDVACAVVNCSVPNNNCSAAITVGNGTIPFNTVGATTDGLSVGTGCIKSKSAQAEADVWYRYVATCTGSLRVSTCGAFGGTANFDTAIVIYADTGVCPPPDANRLGCNDDDAANSCGLLSTATASVTSGSTYLIRIGGVPDALETGSGSFTIACLP